MGNEIRKYHRVVEIALKVIDDEKNISWIEAISKAKEMLEEEVSIKKEGKNCCSSGAMSG